MKEHQLLKDRKKNVRKRPLQGGNCQPSALNAVSNQARGSGNDTRAVKMILVDSQNIIKLGPSKPPLKRNVNMGVNRSNAKGDSNNSKPTRQRKKSGNSFYSLQDLLPILCFKLVFPFVIMYYLCP